jgi:hypothetical protein
MLRVSFRTMVMMDRVVVDVVPLRVVDLNCFTSFGAVFVVVVVVVVIVCCESVGEDRSCGRWGI